MHRRIAPLAALLLGALVPGLALAGCGDASTSRLPCARDPEPGERHLRNIRQLTFGGENAEAYWSFGGDRIVFQSTRPAYKADQILTMSAGGGDMRLVSTGTARTTCA